MGKKCGKKRCGANQKPKTRVCTPPITESHKRESLPHRPRREKLAKRFYEPLVLLNCLGTVQGDHSERQQVDVNNPADFGDTELRRKFLDNLCLICDYEKGGQTVTAAALQDGPQGTIYWIAANEDPRKRIGGFLREILSLLGNLSFADGPAAEEKVFRAAVGFCRRKIKKLWGLLKGPLAKCSALLSGDSSHDGLLSWLTTFNACGEDVEELSKHAFQQRGCVYLMELANLCAVRWSSTIPQSLLAEFKKVRHYIGRLGSLRRASQILVTTAIRMPELFEVAGVNFCPSNGSCPGPSIDERLNLEGIATRMLPKDELERYGELLDALTFMDHSFGLMGRIREHYEDKNFQPRVHAELALMELIDRAKIDFVGRDKYIGCSKPSCFCCYHYIRLHPGDFILPACHHKIYLNWRAPDLPAAADESSENCQREIMNRLIAVIRVKAIAQVLGRSRSRTWQPDSTTGITCSSNSESRLTYAVTNKSWSNSHLTGPPLIGYGKSPSQQPMIDTKRKNSVSSDIANEDVNEERWTGDIQKTENRFSNTALRFRHDTIGEATDNAVDDGSYDEEFSDSDGGVLVGPLP